MKIFHKLIQEIQLANRRYGLFRKNDSLVVGLSGGPDSTALLVLLSRLKRKYSFKLAAAHLDHGLDKKEAKKYLIAAKNVSESLGVRFFCKSADVRKIAKKLGRSIEEAGRDQRYIFFTEVAAKCRTDKIVTAHTLDDQAETMLMRIVRGSGLRGLGGIPFKREHGAFEVIRPLLLSEKKDILGFLKESDIPFALDRSNAKPDFFRNRVRHKLLPLVSEFNPEIKRSLANLQAICGDASSYLERQSARSFSRCLEKSNKRTFKFRLSRLQRLDPAILGEVLYRAIEKIQGHMKAYAYVHISDIIALINSKEPSLSLRLPGSLTVSKKKGAIEFSLK